MSALRQFGRRLAPRSRALRSPIGLEFGDDGLHLVQLTAGSDGPRVSAQSYTPYVVSRADTLDSVAATKRLVRQGLAKGAFSGRRVVTALSAKDTRLLSLTYQVRGGESDAEAIARLMAERIDDELDQFVVDYIPIRSEARDGDRVALVVISERTSAVAYLELLRKAGLKVEALEIAPVAIRRFVSTLTAQRRMSSDVLVIDVGLESSHLIVVSGRRLLFEQRVDFGTAALSQSLVDALDMPPDLAGELISQRGLETEAGESADSVRFNAVAEILQPKFRGLVNEIRRAVLFAASETRGTNIQEAFLIGKLAAWKGATRLLADMTDLNVTVPPGLTGPETAAAGAADTGGLIAAGLALRGIDADA